MRGATAGRNVEQVGGVAGTLPVTREHAMLARSVTFAGDPVAVDTGIALVRDEVMPKMLSLMGCGGVSMLVERASGECIVTSSWHSADSMAAGFVAMTDLRARLAAVLGGAPKVEEWEVACMHREHAASEGSCCRVTWLRLPQGGIDRGIDVYRSALLPEMETIPGFCSSSLLVNRPAGRACATATYTSLEAMVGSRNRAWAIRDAGVRDAGVDVLDVVEYELVLAHLRLPELV